MKAAVLEGPEKITVRDIPSPSPDKHEVLIKVKCCGICGSDLGLYKMGLGENRVMGHEFSGDIAEVGENVTNWSVGERVVVEPTLRCQECYWCEKKQYNLCNSYGNTGINRDGGFAEYVTVPEYQLFKLPAEISYEEGALVEPSAVALRAIWKSHLKPGAKVAVFGCGTLGLLVLLWSKAVGAGRIFATEMVESKIAIAEKYTDAVINPATESAADRMLELTDGIGPDIVFECTGNALAVAQAVDVVKKKGQIIVLGMSFEPTPLSLLTLCMKEITLKGTLAYNSVSKEGEFSTAINFLKSKRLDARSIVSSTIPLSDITAKGFSKLSTGEAIKVLVTP